MSTTNEAQLLTSETRKEPRQLKGIEGLLGLATRFIPTQKPVKVEKLEPTISGDGIKRMKLTYGPFKLRAANTTKKEGNFFSFDPQGTGWAYIADGFPSDITIVNGRMSIGYDDGSLIGNVNGVYNHHAFFLDISKGLKSNVKCKDASISIPALNSITGSAADSGAAPKISAKPVTGNFIEKGHKVLLTGDLVNYNNETKEVYMSTDLHYLEGKGIGLLETTVHLLTVGMCEKNTNPIEALFIKPPKDKKKFSIQGAGMEIKDDGKILALRGHMHGKSNRGYSLGCLRLHHN